MSKSKIFLYLIFSFIFGVSIASFFTDIPIFFYLIALCVFLILVIVWRKEQKMKILGFCGLFFILGMARFMFSLPSDSDRIMKFYNDKEEIEFQGIVADEPDIRKDKIKLTIDSEKIRQKDIWIDIEGKILVDVARFPEYSYGDFLNINCQLQTPAEFEDFSYKDYLAKADIYSVCYRAQVNIIEHDKGNYLIASLLKIKTRFKNTISSILTEPHASFLQGMLLGSKQGMPDDLKESFSLTGTSHIIVISGLHITIVAGSLVYLAQILSFPRKYVLLFATVGLIFFILLIGAKPSAIRAGIMGSLIILAMYSGRLSDTKNAILCAASIIILINPKVLRFDVGFQLSFLATIGIIYLSPYLNKVIKIIPNFFKMREIIAMTLAAQILTLPIVVYNFERISIVSPLVNVLIVPIIPITIIVGFIAMFLGVIWLYLGKLFSIFVWFLLEYEIYVVSIFSKIPIASIEVNKLWIGWIIIYYFIIAFIIQYLRKKEKIVL
ncbi:MAG: ComEC family competence protein [Parcubacteria group bacterium]|nr:ComEC family competence protein [Parcubacteria group bacterium]